MDRKKYIVEASDDVKKVMALGVTHGGAIWTDTTDIENLEELNSDYINEHFGWLQDDAYQRGLDDAWECMKKIAFLEKPRDMRDFLGHTTFGGILTGYTAAEAIAKLKAYEEKQKADGEIKVGDEVIYNGTTKCIVVRPEDDERYASLIDSDGTHYSADHRECKKTGRHFDIKSILEDMRHD